MKHQRIKFFGLLIIALILASGMSCQTTGRPVTKSVPPGQMKKITGSQSAKPFAPGQQKKKK